MGILDLLYPRQCPVCRKIVKQRNREEGNFFPRNIGMEKLICYDCYGKVAFVKRPTCMRCGKSIPEEEKEYCGDCARKEQSFERGVALMDYSKDISRQIIWDLKYQNKREYADFLALEMSRRFYRTVSDWNCDAIVPVPMYPAKKRKRGYNQAEVLARRVGEILDIPVDSHALFRVRNTAPSKELSSGERAKNLRGAFQAGKTAGRYQRILLVDDIYTTGGTAQACTRVLLKAGVDKVFLLNGCIGRGE